MKSKVKIFTLALALGLSGTAAADFPQAGDWSTGLLGSKMLLGSSSERKLSAENIDDFRERAIKAEYMRSETKSTIFEFGLSDTKIQGSRKNVDSYRLSAGSRHFGNDGLLPGLRPLVGYGAGIQHYDAGSYGNSTEGFGYVEAGVQAAFSSSVIFEAGYRERVEIENGDNSGQAFLGFSFVL